MISSGERSKLIEKFGSFLEQLEGQAVSITESITRNREHGHDRHFAVRSGFEISVEKVLWTMSGGHFYLYGKDDFQYGVASSQLNEVCIDGFSAEIKELFETKTERLTIIKMIDK